MAIRGRNAGQLGTPFCKMNVYRERAAILTSMHLSHVSCHLHLVSVALSSVFATKTKQAFNRLKAHLRLDVRHFNLPCTPFLSPFLCG
jgi:hypothetical protein